MTKKCPGCKTVYSNDVWFSKLGICSICEHTHRHSTWQEYNPKLKKFVKRKRGLDKFI